MIFFDEFLWRFSSDKRRRQEIPSICSWVVLMSQWRRFNGRTDSLALEHFALSLLFGDGIKRIRKLLLEWKVCQFFFILVLFHNPKQIQLWLSSRHFLLLPPFKTMSSLAVVIKTPRWLWISTKFTEPYFIRNLILRKWIPRENNSS